jgi:hypothetical protein
MRASRYAIRDGSLRRDQGVRVPAKAHRQVRLGYLLGTVSRIRPDAQCQS